MTLRVYLINNNGDTDFLDYGLDATNYKGILKTEIREDSTKVKAWSGSKYVGIPDIDNPPKPKKQSSVITSNYEIFNYNIHDTDKKYYWISALCSNCNNNTQIAVPQKQKIDKRRFKDLVCPKCNCEKTLQSAKWDGKKYVRISK